MKLIKEILAKLIIVLQGPMLFIITYIIYVEFSTEENQNTTATLLTVIIPSIIATGLVVWSTIQQNRRTDEQNIRAAWLLSITSYLFAISLVVLTG